MIYIDDNDPEGVLEPSFPPKDVNIKYNTNARELYDTIGEIGRGKFGTVYKCREKATGLKLAAKFIPIPKREDRRNVEREVEIMNSLQHHLIIQLYAAYEYQKMMYVIQELVEGGELFDRVIDDEFVLTERVCTVFVRQICEAMQFIHSKYILHLDLKPENILCITKEGNRIKIIDFGLARKYDPEKKLQILFGTPEFVAPEVVNFDCISYGTDMWSVGVICYVLISGLSPFMGETDLETMANVTIAKYDFDDVAFNDVSPESLDFISKLLVKNLNDRMTAAEALEHKWLKRPPKPPLSPKPTNIPPIKFKTTPPTPLPFINYNRECLSEKELEQTKDNLKNFIERWEEHPNSPYVVCDTESTLMVPLRDNKADSINSSRACSPSPCESILSVPETDVETSKEDLTNRTLTPSSSDSFDKFGHNQSSFNESMSDSPNESLSASIHKPSDMDGEAAQQYDKDFKEYLQSFERRNSDTNYLLGRRSSGEKVNLADEIKKLSEHLRMLAEINTKLGKDDNEPKSKTSDESTKETKSSAIAPITSNQETSKIKIFDRQKSLNPEPAKQRNQFERQQSVTKPTIVEPTPFGLSKSPTISRQFQIKIANEKESNKCNTSAVIAKPKPLIARQWTIQSEDDDLSTSSTISLAPKRSVAKNAIPTVPNKSDKSPTPSAPAIRNDERRLSDTQSAALTISKFVQTSQIKEKATQFSFAQNYKEQQRLPQQQQVQKQNNKNSNNGRKISTLSVYLDQSIDEIPKIANSNRQYEQCGQEQQQQQQKFFHQRQNSQTNNSSYTINRNSLSSSPYTTATFVLKRPQSHSNATPPPPSVLNSAASNPTKSMYNGYMNNGCSTRQVSSIKESIECNRQLNSATTATTATAIPFTNRGSTPQRRMSSSIASIFEKFSDNPSLNQCRDGNDDFSANQFRIGVPWAMHTKKRTKFRINEASRDVPLSSPNTHQTYNLEEAATQTKDCLLHLLEKYNDTKMRSSAGTARHQSISIDSDISQNLEYQSMNSINHFFQRNAFAGGGGGGKVRNIQAQLESKNGHD